MQSWLRWGSVILSLLLPLASHTGSGKREKLPNYQKIDFIVTSYMRERRIPGASLAIAKHGKFILRKGYGRASPQRIVTPWSLFRIGSISKTVTAVGILKLKEEGRLDLQSIVFGTNGILSEFELPRAADLSIANITVRDLLQHSGGWDQRNTFDPLMQKNIGKHVGKNGPPDIRDIVQYMLRQPLQHPPGTTYAYSNFGYVLLGLVIEKITGMKYELYLNSQLRRAGVYRMKLGRTEKHLADISEVEYYSKYPSDRVISVLNPDSLVSPPYGGFYLENMAASNGWIASASELVLLFDSLSGECHQSVLAKSTVETMKAAPKYTQSSFWYALGLVVENGGDSWWHSGMLEGSTSMAAHDKNGYTWAALLNDKLENNDLADLVRYAVWKTFESNQPNLTENKADSAISKEFADAVSSDGHYSVKLLTPEYQLKVLVKKLAPQGFMLTWINAYDEYGNVYFNTIWTKREGIGWKVYIGMSATKYKKILKAKMAQGYRLAFIQCYVSRRRLRYASIFVREEWPQWVTYEGYGIDRHKTQFYKCLEEGYRLVVQSVTEYRGKVYIAAIYDRINLGEFRVRLGLSIRDYNEELERQLQSGRILSYVQTYEHRGMLRFSAIWMAKTTKAWAVSHGMTKYTLLNKIQEYAEANVPLSCVSAYYDGDILNFAALWR